MSKIVIKKVSELVDDVYKGKVVIPDFQRNFVWEPENVRELLVSALGGYFMGPMLVLEQAHISSPFSVRLVEGVKEINNDANIPSFITIILDGQQRTTSLFYALHEPKIPLKNRKSSYKFYLDIEKALDKNWNEAVTSVSVSDKRRLSEFTKRENKSVVSFKQLNSVGGLAVTFANHPRCNEICELANNFRNHEVHTVHLKEDTSLERIVETFERINRTGESLSIFELLTARLYKHGIRLRDILKSSKEKYEVLEFVAPEFVLKTIALIRSTEPKRREILELEPKDFEQDWESAAQSLEEAYERVIDVKNGYGALDFKKWVPYTTMLVPLAVSLRFLKSGRLQSPKNYEKVDSWYWTSVFLNRYDHAVDTTSASDFNLVKQWLSDDVKTPDFVQEFDFEKIDLNVNRQTSAIYRGVMNLVVLAGALDFKTGQPPQFNKREIQEDHIFPKSLYHENGDTDLVTNRTLISTNAEKLNKHPSAFFAEKRDKQGEAKLKEILRSHLIPEDALEYLLKDNLQEFLIKRKQAIKNELRRKIGRVSESRGVEKP